MAKATPNCAQPSKTRGLVLRRTIAAPIVLPTGEPTYLTDGAYDAFPAWRPEPGP